MKKLLLVIVLSIGVSGCATLDKFFADQPEALQSAYNLVSGIAIKEIRVYPELKAVAIVWELRDRANNNKVIVGGQVDMTLAEFQNMKSMADVMRWIQDKALNCALGAKGVAEPITINAEAGVSCQVQK